MKNELLSEMTMITTIIANAKIVQHLDAAERMMKHFVRKWQISTDKHPDAICDAIFEEIIARRNEMMAEDMKNAERIASTNS